MRLRTLPACGHARFIHPLAHFHFFKNLGQFRLHKIEEHLGCDGLEFEALHIFLDEGIEARASHSTFTFLQKETTLVIRNAKRARIGIRRVRPFQAGLRRVHADALYGRHDLPFVEDRI
jgi:hypothetical protein